MDKVKLQKLGFGSYIKINAIGGFWTGLIFGLIGFGLTLLGFDASSVSVGGYNFSGTMGGILALVITPPLMALILAILSIFFGIGLKLHLFILRGIKVKAKFKELETKNSEVAKKAVEKSESPEVTD